MGNDIRKNKDGSLHIPASHVFTFRDNKCDVDHTIAAGDVTVEGAEYFFTYGIRKGIVDAHGWVKEGREVPHPAPTADTGPKIVLGEDDVAAVAGLVAWDRWVKANAGDMSANAGRMRIDPVVGEMLSICAARCKCSVATFRKRFDIGGEDGRTVADGILAYATKRVANAFANGGVKFVASNSKHAAKVSTHVESIRNVAVKNIESAATPDGIDLSDIG